MSKSFSLTIQREDVHSIPQDLHTLQTSDPQIYSSIINHIKQKHSVFKQINWNPAKFVFQHYSKYLFYMEYVHRALNHLQAKEVVPYVVLLTISSYVDMDVEWRLKVFESLCVNMVKLVSDSYFLAFGNGSREIEDHLLCFYFFIVFVERSKSSRHPFAKIVFKLCQKFAQKIKQVKADQAKKAEKQKKVKEQATKTTEALKEDNTTKDAKESGKNKVDALNEESTTPKVLSNVLDI